MYRLIICVFGCITIEKYRNQIKKIKDTYEKTGNENEHIKILYFLGEKKYEDYHDTNFIYLDGVSDDYMSASYKQNLGLKYIYENYKPEFVLCCGSDTFINIPKLLTYLDEFNPCDNLYIGGHGCHRSIGIKTYYFHSGAGFILSNECLKHMYPFLNNLTDDWKNICKNNNVEYLTPACDVAISYYLQKNEDVQIIKSNDSSFMNCNYKGHPCHMSTIKINEIILCHNMSFDDFDNFNDILLSNNFFITFKKF